MRRSTQPSRRCHPRRDERIVCEDGLLLAIRTRSNAWLLGDVRLDGREEARTLPSALRGCGLKSATPG